MKLKHVLLILIFLITPIILSGCVSISDFIKNDNTFQDLEQAFDKFKDTTDIDMDFTTKIDTVDTSVTVNSKMIIKDHGDQTLVYVKTGEGDQAAEMYVIDGYLYSESDGDYTITDATEFDLLEENPIPNDLLDFSDLSYSFKSAEIDNEIFYTVTITEDSLKTYVEKILDSSIGDMQIKMILQAKVNSVTEELESIKYNITLSQDDYIINFETVVTINALGDLVELVVPNSVTDRIEQYQMGHSNSDPDPITDTNPTTDQEPTTDPVSNDYLDTTDGIVQYHDLDEFKNIVFDDKTNQLIIQRVNSIEIRDADTLEINRTIRTLLTPKNIDVDNGKLVVSYNTNQFKIYDLSQEIEPTTIQTTINVSEIVIDNNMVIYADDDQWCTIVFHNINTNEKKSINSVYEPLFTLNRKDHLLYVTETGLSSSELQYYNSQTGERLYSSHFSQFVYVHDRIMFDGKYLHHEGQSFNRFNGNVVSSSYLDQMYEALAGFTPEVTLLNSENTSFIGSVLSQQKIGIYDNINQNYVYQFPFNGDNIIELKDGKYLAFGTNQNYVAIVDTLLINEGLISNDTEDQVGVVNVSDDGQLKTLEDSIYTDSIMDGHYLYTLNESNYELNVYDVETLEKIHTEHFILKPVSMDAYSGKLVIGYGEAYQFRIYDTTTWEYEIVVTVDPVYSTIIYKDTIIYSEIDQHCYIKVYNMTTKTHSNFGYSGYYVSMAINREDGIIYFGDRNSSSNNLAYFNLETKQNIYSKSISYYKNTVVSFDGNFVHYQNQTFDKTTGIKISNSDLAQLYQNNSLTDVKTIFDNEDISIYTGIKDDQIITVIYDLSTNTQLYSIASVSTHAYVVGDTIVLLNNSSEFIRTLTLSE